MSNVLVVKSVAEYQPKTFDVQRFIEFKNRVEVMTFETAEAFAEWEAESSTLSVTLEADPTLNLAGFYGKLEEAQTQKNEMVEIITQSLAQRAVWESIVSEADRYVRRLRSELVQEPNVKQQKNKEMQEAVMYGMRPDVFDCLKHGEAVLGWVKTMIQVLDKKADSLDSANLNINRQITVTELLTYKGLL